MGAKAWLELGTKPAFLGLEQTLSRNQILCRHVLRVDCFCLSNMLTCHAQFGEWVTILTFICLRAKSTGHDKNIYYQWLLGHGYRQINAAFFFSLFPNVNIRTVLSYPTVSVGAASFATSYGHSCLSFLYVPSSPVPNLSFFLRAPKRLAIVILFESVNPLIAKLFNCEIFGRSWYRYVLTSSYSPP